MPSHQHSHIQDHVHSDLGPMYEKEWVQKLIRQTQEFLQTNITWLGIDPSKPQRVLDYGCGNGTVSSGLLNNFPQATFQGIDIAISQVQRYNDEAAKLLGEPHDRMFAIQGDLNDPSPVLSEPKWNAFDIAIISLALHHVKDPIEYLKRLRQRVKPDGVILVIEFLRSSSGAGNHDGNHQAETGSGEPKYKEEHMHQVPDGHKIWPGFTEGEIKTNMIAAGCADVDVKVYSEALEIPGNIPGFDKMFIAKATVV